MATLNRNAVNAPITRPLGPLVRTRPVKNSAKTTSGSNASDRPVRRPIKAHVQVRPWAWLNKNGDAISAITSLITMISIAYGVFTYTILDAPAREEASERTAIADAWQTLNSALGQGGDAGRVSALTFLNDHDEILTGVTLQGASLSLLNLQRATMDRASFEDADLRTVSFGDALLAQANFKKATLYNVDFGDANLSGANFEGAVIVFSRFRNTNLRFANFKGAFIYSDVEFDDAFLEHTNLLEATCFNMSSLSEKQRADFVQSDSPTTQWMPGPCE